MACVKSSSATRKGILETEANLNRKKKHKLWLKYFLINNFHCVAQIPQTIFMLSSTFPTLQHCYTTWTNSKCGCLARCLNTYPLMIHILCTTQTILLDYWQSTSPYYRSIWWCSMLHGSSLLERLSQWLQSVGSLWAKVSTRSLNEFLDKLGRTFI